MRGSKERYVKFPNTRLILALGVSIGVVAGLLTVIDHPVTGLHAEKAAREYRATSLPWRGSDLMREVPLTENGADVVQRCIDCKSGLDFELTGLVRKQYSQEDYASVLSTIEPFNEELDAVVQSGQKRYLDFGRNWEEPQSMVFPELGYLVSASELISLRAGIPDDRPVDDRLRDLRAVFLIGEKLGQEPDHFGTLTGAKILFYAVQGATLTASLKPDDAEWVSSVRREVDQWETTLSLRTGLGGLAISSLAYIRNCPILIWEDIHRAVCVKITTGSYSEQAVWTNRIKSGIPKGIEKRALFVRTAQLFTAWDTIAAEYSDDPIEAGRRMDQVAINHLEGKWQLSAKTLLGMVGGMEGIGMRIEEARFSLTAAKRVLWAAEVFSKTGSVSSPDEVVGDMTDRISGKSPIVTIDRNAIEIYSLGADGIDDGGPRPGNSFHKQNFGAQVTLNSKN